MGILEALKVAGAVLILFIAIALIAALLSTGIVA